MNTLVPFQKTGVDFLLSRRRCLLADDAGLGKTVQALSATVESKLKYANILVVAPASLLCQWEKEIAKWVPDDKGRTIIQIRSEKTPVVLTGRYRFILASYDYVRKHHERLSKVRWQIVIADEAQALKNWKSKTCRAFRKLTVKHDGYIWYMTATPATRGGDDYYAFLEMIQPGKWGSLSAFRDVFCEVSVDYAGYRTYHGVKESKRPILRKAFSKVMLRRLKRDVQKELPPIVSTQLPVVLNASLMKELSGIPVSVMERMIASGGKLDAHVMRELHLIGLGKVESAVDYLLGVGDEQVVVFCRHTDVLKEIQNRLMAEGRVGVAFHGEMSRTAKDESVRIFTDGSVQFFFVNIKAGGVGLNLQTASHMLVVEQDWSPAIMDQAVARIHRMGQKALSLTVTHLIAVGTADENVLDILRYKSEFINAIMGDLWKKAA